MQQGAPQGRHTVRILAQAIGTISPIRCPFPDPETAAHDQLCVLKPILEDFPIGVVIVDSHGRFAVFNGEAQRILAMGALDVPATAWPEEYGCYLPDQTTLFPADRMPLARALLGEEVTAELMFVRNPRQPKGAWIRISSRPLPPMSGGGRWAVAVFTDVTDQRKALEEVELLSRAVEQTADSVVITDFNGIITYVNPAFEGTTGYSRAEVMGQTPRVLKSGVHEPRFYEAMWAKLTDGKPFRGTLRNRKKNGELYWAEQTIAPIFGDHGEVTHYVSVLKDITESRKQQEHQIQMRLARDVQQRFYLRTVAVPGLDVGSVVHPAEQTGGDYVDFITPGAGDGTLRVAVGDVGGHGFDAALVMALTRAYVRSCCQQGLEVGQLLGCVNKMLLADLEDSRYVTLLLAQFDLPARVLSYASAGHVPGFVLDASGNLESMLESTGVPLGMFEGRRFGTTSLAVKPGQVIVLLTDGATEAGQPNDFGIDRVIAYARAHRDEPGQQIADGLYSEIRAFTGGEPAQDDVSLVVLKVE